MKNMYNTFKKQMIEIDVNYHQNRVFELESLKKWAKKMLKNDFLDLYGWTIFLICNHFLKNREPEKSQPFLNELQKIAEVKQDYALVYYLILDGVYNLYFLSDIDKCIKNGETAISVFKEAKLNDQLLLFNTLQLLFSAFMMKDDTNRAFRYSNEALKCKLNKQLVFRKANTYNWLGMLESDYTRNYKAAIFNYLKAAEIYKKSSNFSSYSTVLDKICFLYIKVKKYDEALETINMAIKIAKEYNYHYMALVFHITLGTLYRHLGKYKEANECFQLVLAADDKLDPNGLAEANIETGRLYTDMNEFGNANTNFLKAMEIYAKYERDDKIFEISIHLSDMFIKQNELDKAKEYLDKADEILKNIDDRNYQFKLYDTYYQYYKKKMEYKESLEYLEKYVKIKDEIVDELLKANLELSEIKYGN